MSGETAIVRALGTWFGCGNSPLAPGTVGTIGALPLYWAIKRLNPPLYWSAVVATTAAGIWASNRMAESLHDDDPSSVVIDEVAGALLALGLVRGRGWRSELVALALFRALDIYKPGPIKLAESARPPGLGIMLDDVVAGGLAGVLTRLL